MTAPYDEQVHLTCNECGAEDTFSGQVDKSWAEQRSGKGKIIVTYEIKIDNSPNRPYDEKKKTWQCLKCGSFDTIQDAL